MQGNTKPKDLNEWYDTVAEYGDGPLYAEQVYEVLKKGASAKTSTGEKVPLEAQEGVEPQHTLTTQAASETADYSGATWYGASSYNCTAANRPSSNPINKIVIHVTQRPWSSAINAFQNSSHQASAHYTVRSSDGFIGQLVREKDIAWHAGNWPYNQTSIGIEHEGYVSDPSWFTTPCTARRPSSRHLWRKSTVSPSTATTSSGTTRSPTRTPTPTRVTTGTGTST